MAALRLAGDPGRTDGSERRQRSGLANRQDSIVEPIAKSRGTANLAKLIAPRHKRIARAIGFALTANTPDAWRDFASICELGLTLPERGAVAFAVLNALGSDAAREVLSAVLVAQDDRADTPLSALTSAMDDARSWASLASDRDLKVHALACFEAMSAQDQAAFFHHIREMEIAA